MTHEPIYPRKMTATRFNQGCIKALGVQFLGDEEYSNIRSEKFFFAIECLLLIFFFLVHKTILQISTRNESRTAKNNNLVRK